MLVVLLLFYPYGKSPAYQNRKICTIWAGELNLGKDGLIRYAMKEDLLVIARSQ